MIGIVDLGMGNLKSVSNATYQLGYDCVLVNQRSALDDLSHLILPGVGSYSAAMGYMVQMDLKDGILDFVRSGRPVLGICLGMQLLSTGGEEGIWTDGLNVIPGEVRKIEPSEGIMVPHIGWNTTRFRAGHPVLHKIKSGVDFYYVHSYSFNCESPSNVFATTEYGSEFASAIGRDNVFGVQFHPEKSQSNGIKLLENFCNWNGGC